MGCLLSCHSRPLTTTQGHHPRSCGAMTPRKISRMEVALLWIKAGRRVEKTMSDALVRHFQRSKVEVTDSSHPRIESVTELGSGYLCAAFTCTPCTPFRNSMLESSIFGPNPELSTSLMHPEHLHLLKPRLCISRNLSPRRFGRAQTARFAVYT